ncbi:MAG: amidohydrolase family protein [Planctomycetota bacterium]|nr:amidohydrolase family protein [Planctomycetota bacterium]
MQHSIDSHQHFWSYEPSLYPWIDGELAPLGRDFLPADLAPVLAEHSIAGTVAVQARQDRDETLWLLQLADANPWILGVVGWIDLRAQDVGAELAAVAHPKLRGIRHVLQDESPEFLLDEAFQRGVGQLATAGLTYDVLVYPQHLPNSFTLCEDNPELWMVIDHCAKPGIKTGELRPWSDDIRRIAELPNVLCKVSGLVTEAAWHSWKPEDFKIYLDIVFEAFGPDRLMFGSDWPVCTVAGSYQQVHELIADYTHDLNDGVRAALFGGNARRFYGLELPDA